MDKPTFWRLIEESKQQSHGEIRAQAKGLLRLLYYALVRVFVYVHHEELMNFVEWLIGQGEALCTGVMRHPTHVGDILSGDSLAAYNGDILQSAISEAYWRVTGRSLDGEKLEVEDAVREERRKKREDDQDLLRRWLTGATSWRFRCTSPARRCW